MVSSSAHKKTSTAEDAIRAADEGWERVFSAKDLQRSLEFCAGEASFMAPILRLPKENRRLGGRLPASSLFRI